MTCVAIGSTGKVQESGIDGEVSAMASSMRVDLSRVRNDRNV